MAPNTSMPIGWADSFGRKLRIGAAARRSYGLARGAQGMGIAAEDLQVRSSPVAFRKIEASISGRRRIRAAGEVYPSATLALTKSEVCRIMFVITESVLTLRLSRARSGPWLFDKRAQAQPASESRGRGEFFIPIARNPLKSTDFEK